MSFMSTTGKKVSDLLGKKFNRLTVDSYLGKGLHDKHYWSCTCEWVTVSENSRRVKRGKPQRKI